MPAWLRHLFWPSLAFAGAVHAADEPARIIDVNKPGFTWSFHRNPDTTCVITGTAVSEMRDDAFEVQFRHSRGQKLKLFVLIPGLPKGGSVYMESPTTRDRWRIFTESYVPALEGDKAEVLQRNVAAGIPLHFTFEFPKAKPVKYETIPRGAVLAAHDFRSCVDYNANESLKAERK